ncbi:MAG TPA: hypothetical protein VEP90_11370 [Methylomirabilota bacterium]|nr:hypothetical protein [Methylomirabilota bacterium]
MKQLKEWVATWWPLFLAAVAMFCNLEMFINAIKGNQPGVLHWLLWFLVFGVPFLIIVFWTSWKDMKADQKRRWEEMEVRHAAERAEMKNYEQEVRDYISNHYKKESE